MNCEIIYVHEYKIKVKLYLFFVHVCNRDINTTVQHDNSRKASSKSPVDYFADDVDFEHID